MTLREAAEQLYGLPPKEFTPRRNALVKELRPHDPELAEAVRRLPRPAVAAWAVNALVRREAPELTQLLDLAEQLREAQHDLAGEALRELTAEARPLVAALKRQARQVTADAGASLSESAAGQVEQTLRAALADAQAAQALREGLLTRSLRAVGFGGVDLDGAVAVEPGTAAPGRAAPPRRKKPPGSAGDKREAQQAAKAALREAERAEKQLSRTASQVEAAATRHREAQRRVQELREQLADAEREQAESRAAVRDARRARDAAAKAARTAERAAARATSRLDKLRRR